MDEIKDFKLPSNITAEKQKEAQANVSVLVQAIEPCIVNGTYYVGGNQFITDKSYADELVTAKIAVIVQ